MYSLEDIELTSRTTVTALLSAGKFSRVYLCKHAHLHGNLAPVTLVIKVYPRVIAMTRHARITTEKAVMTRIGEHRNPFMVRLIETLKDNAHLYIVMEAYRHGHLNSHVAGSRERSLSVAVLRNYAAEIVSALLCLMTCGCVHRDIKPKNFMIDKFGHLRLGDFGSSKILFESEKFSEIIMHGTEISPRTHTIIGTMQYMAPEILSKSCGYSVHVDWWAFGVMLFEIICGVSPVLSGVATLDNNSAVAAASQGFWPDPATSAIAHDAAIKRLPCDNQLNKDEGDLTTPSSMPWYPVLNPTTSAILSSSPLHRYAWHFIKNLLIPCPHDRLGPWREDLVKSHPFFEGVDWDLVDSGSSPAPDPDFHQLKGLWDEEEETQSISEDIEPNVFEGF